jgi:hypothetical protein
MQATPIRQFKRVTVEQKRGEVRVRRCKQAAICLGLLFACIGIAWIARTCFSSKAMPVAQTPAQWPIESSIAKDGKSPTMVMFVEPESQDARACMDELRRVVMDKEVNAVVVIRQPEQSADQSPDSPLIRAASQLPNTTIVVDHTGREAEYFHVQQSGQCLLYDQMGRLQFEGNLASSNSSSATPQNDRHQIDFILAGHKRTGTLRSAGTSAIE